MINRRESMTFMEKMANTESRSVSFFGDKDDYWFKMIQRNWHGSLETFRVTSDKRTGVNNAMYDSGPEGIYISSYIIIINTVILAIQ